MEPLSEEESYFIRPFLLHELPNEDLVVQHEYGIVKVNNNLMKEFIRRADISVKTRVSNSYLYKQFGENVTKSIDFLVENHILKKMVPMNFQIESIKFLSLDEEVKHLVDKAFHDIPDWQSFSQISIEDYMKHINKDRSEFFVVFMNPYKRSLAHQLRDAFLENDNSYSMMSYIYHNTFYIESIYSYLWKTPCHKCQIGHIESELRLGSHSGDTLTYQQLVDSLYIEDSEFSVGTPLTFRNKLSITSQLCNRIESLLSIRNQIPIHQEEFTRGIVVDILTNNYFTDNTHHWEMCDCYER